MSEQGLTREKLTVELYGGEDYRVYDGTRLIATVYAEDDLIWLLDRDAQQLERLEDCKESERVADIRFYEIKHLKAELEQVKRERDRWYGAAQERQIETNILQQQLAEANKTMSGAWESMGNFSKRIEELKHEIDLRDSQLAAREGLISKMEMAIDRGCRQTNMEQDDNRGSECRHNILEALQAIAKGDDPIHTKTGT